MLCCAGFCESCREHWIFRLVCRIQKYSNTEKYDPCNLFHSITSRYFLTQECLSRVNAPLENMSARSGDPETKLLIQGFFKINLLTGHLGDLAHSQNHHHQWDIITFPIKPTLNSRVKINAVNRRHFYFERLVIKQNGRGTEQLASAKHFYWDQCQFPIALSANPAPSL